MTFENTGSLNMGIVILGTGVLASTTSFEEVKQPYQKSIDELRINSRLGYKTSPNSKFSYATDFGFISQLAPTYHHFISGGQIICTGLCDVCAWSGL